MAGHWVDPNPSKRVSVLTQGNLTNPFYEPARAGNWEWVGDWHDQWRWDPTYVDPLTGGLGWVRTSPGWSWNGTWWVFDATIPGADPNTYVPPEPHSGGPNTSTTSFNGSDFSSAIAPDKAVLPIVYGDQRVEGQVIALKDGLISGEGNWGAFVIAVCLGPIQSINGLYINGNQKTWDNSSYATGAYHMDIWTGEYGQSPEVWILPGGFKLPGVAYVRIQIYGDGNQWYPWTRFVSDTPHFSFDVSGMKTLNMSNASVYSKNPALIARDSIIDKEHGAGLDSTKIDTTSFTASYNYYD